MDCAMRAALMVMTPGLGVETLITLHENARSILFQHLSSELDLRLQNQHEQCRLHLVWFFTKCRE